MPLVTAPVELEVTPNRAFQRNFTYLDSGGDPVDLTGKKAKLEARRESDNVLIFYLSTETDPLKTGTITLGGVAGTISLTITGTKTTTLFWTDQVAYDFVLYTTVDDAVSLFGGTVTLGAKVTVIV